MRDGQLFHRTVLMFSFFFYLITDKSSNIITELLGETRQFHFYVTIWFLGYLTNMHQLQTTFRVKLDETSIVFNWEMGYPWLD